MSLKEALLAYAHFVAIFGLAVTLVAELVLLRPAMDAALFRRLRSVDLGYGIAAIGVAITGVLRLTLGAKGAAYYAGDPVFWAKMALFLAVGLLSIPPTVSYLRWRKLAAPDGSLVLSATAYGRTRTLLWVEIGLFCLIPLCATFIAYGVR
jgi:putative membrane protein